RAIETGFFVVPEDEADRSIGLDIGAAQHAGDFHHERCAGAVVVCRFTPTMAIHVRAKDIHFLGMRDADLRTVDLFARTRQRGLTVELAQFCISLFHRVCVHARRHPCSPRPTSSRSGVRRQIRSGACLRLVIVGQPFAIDTSITLQLLLDPVDGSAVALRSLAPVPELGEPFDGGFVFSSSKRSTRSFTGSCANAGVAKMVMRKSLTICCCMDSYISRTRPSPSGRG